MFQFLPKTGYYGGFWIILVKAKSNCSVPELSMNVCVHRNIPPIHVPQTFYLKAK